MLTAVDSKQCNNNQLNHMPQMQEPHIVTTLPDTNKLQHFDAYKQPFPLTANHTGSMPILPTQDQSMKYNPIQNSHPRQDFQVPQQQAPPVYPSIPRYPPNHARLNPDTQNIQTSISIPAVEKISPFGSNESTLVTFVDLKSFYEKGQCRLQGKSEQRLDYASSFVRIYLEKPDNVQVRVYYTIPYHAMPCHAMPCHAMPCHAMPCHAMPCHAMPCHAMPCHAMPCHAISYQLS